MKKLFYILLILFFEIFISENSMCQKSSNSDQISIKIDGSKRFQQIDGIGVNANTSVWNGKELEPGLNMLLDSMNATIWRVIVETVYNWEDKNDNNDPFTFNWEYYNQLYETPKFQKAWDMIRFLNNRGITDKLIINFMGPVPLWMGGKVVKEKYEDEYVEMLSSFFYYAKNTKHLKIGLISIMNEPDIENEGPTVGPLKYPVLFKKFVERMESLGMGDIKYVATDVAGMENGIHKYMPELVKDPYLMSKIAHYGMHSYAGYYAEVDSMITHSAYPKMDYWVTEWNEWCKGCDDGILGEYNYNFASKCVGHLLSFFQNNATAGIVWEGYDSYYEHHAPSPFSYWGMLAYDPAFKKYNPRKNFYAIQQVSKFVPPGSRRIAVSETNDSLVVLSFYNEISNTVSLVGINKKKTPIHFNASLANLPAVNSLEMYITDNAKNVFHEKSVQLKTNAFNTVIPADCIFTLSTISLENSKKPEPTGWYTGDIHVHRNCGTDSILPYEKLPEMMEPNNLDIISVLADMGNGEVKESEIDLKKVNGTDSPLSKPGRIVHWDTEWHWDATYSNFSNQALGGHLILLGLQDAKQIWEESPYKILDWGKKQNAVRGFAHFQYLNDKIQDDLNCCIPIDYPVETALGNIDFVSEDVFSTTYPQIESFNSEAAINAYYKLLNCGFKIGLAAGTDYPCNDDEPLGSLLTYVKVNDKLTYRKWVEGIKNGRTVVSRNGHNEFLDFKINEKYSPGDVIKFSKKGTVNIEVKWTAIKTLSGRIELVSNGKVIATQLCTAKPGEPVIFNTKLDFAKSGWICARRMDEKGHETHTAPIYIYVDKKPIRASAEDAQFFIDWIDNILKNIEPGQKWNKYFPKHYVTIKERYLKAKAVYQKILTESY